VSSSAPTVLLMQSARPEPELEASLGPDRARELRAELASRAQAVAEELAGGDPARGADEACLSRLVEALFDRRPEPVVVIWPYLPRMGSEHAQAALDDLREGCELVLGPAIDGGLYLLGLSRPLPEVTAAVEEALLNGAAVSMSAAAAASTGLEIGFLRAERALRTAYDVAAAMADPLTPDTIRRILVGGAIAEAKRMS